MSKSREVNESWAGSFPLLPVNQNFAVYRDMASLHRVDLLLLLFIICLR